LKLIKKLSGLAIGLSLIGWSQLIYQDTREQAQKIADSKPIQIPIEKDRPQIIKKFYPEIDAPYEVFLTSSLSNKKYQISKISIVVKTPKIEIIRGYEKIDTSESEIRSGHYSKCYLTHFRSVAHEKHTIIIDFEGVEPKLYTFSPKIEISISKMYRYKGLQNNYIQIFVLGLLGIVFLLVLIFNLLKDFIVNM
jgi:hypothetical protein